MFKQTPHKRVLFVRSLALLLLGVLGVVFVLYSSVIVPSQKVSAATDSTINFQARLLTSGGGIVPDGTYNIEFKLYKSLSAGASTQGVCVGGVTDDCQWMETRTSGNKVTVKGGYLTVNLGSVTAFGASINWDQDLYLTMNIGGTGTASWDGEMSPRIHLTSVPYAFRAGSLAALSGANTATLSFAGTIGQNTSITLPDPGGSTATVCYWSSTACGFAVGSGTAFLQGGNTFSGTTAGSLGTLNNGNLNFLTNGGTKLTLDTSGNLQFAQASTLNVASAATGTQLTIQGGTATSGTNVGGNLMLQGGAGASTGASGSVIVRANTVNSTLAFQVQNAAGSTAILAVDTVNNLAKVTGALDLLGTGTDSFVTPVGSSVPTKINIPVYDAGAYGQELALGLPATNCTGAATSSCTARVISVFDARTLAHQPSIGIFAPDENNIFGFSDEGSNTNSYLKTTNATGAIFLRAGTSDLLQASTSGINLNYAAAANAGLTVANNQTLTANGASLFQDATNNTGAFQIQNATGKQVLTVDTSNGKAILGDTSASGVTGTLVFNTSNNANTVTLTAGATSASYSLTLPTAGPSTSQCLQTDSVTASQLKFGACGSETLQQAYTASAGAAPTIDVTSTNKGVTIQNDNSSPITGELFGVHDKTASGLGATLFSVADTGATLIKTATNSTTGFQVQNATGTSVLNVDTTNKVTNTYDLNVGTAASVNDGGRIFSDGFENDNFNLWNGGTTGSVAIDTTHVRNGTYATKINQSSSADYAKTSFTATTTFALRFYVYATAQPSGPYSLATLYNSGLGTGGSEMSVYRAATSGNLCIYYAAGGTGNSCSSTPLPLNTWSKIELRGTVNATTGSMQVYLNDVAASGAGVTGANTGTAGVDSLDLGSFNTVTQTFWVDDVVVDTAATGDSGSLTVNDSFHVGGSSSFGSNILLQTASNSITAFQVQNASGTNIFNVDTTHSKVGTVDVSTAAANSQAFSLATGDSTTSGNTGALNLLTGNATSGNSGSITMDVGTATGTHGSINIGTNNLTSGINIGPTGATANATTYKIGATTGAAQSIYIGGLNSTGGSASGSVVNIQAGQTGLGLTNTGATFQSFTPVAAGFQVLNAQSQAAITVNSGVTGNVGNVTLGLNTNGPATQNFLDGFENNSTSNFTSNLPSPANGATIATNTAIVHNGKYAAKIVEGTNTAATSFTKVVSIPTGTPFAFREYINAAKSGSSYDVMYFTVATGTTIEVATTGNGSSLCLYNGSCNNTGAPVFNYNQWNKVELVGQMGSTVTLYVNGVSAGSIATTQAKTISGFASGDLDGGNGTTFIAYYDDIDYDTPSTSTPSSIDWSGEGLDVVGSANVTGDFWARGASIFQDGTSTTSAFKVQNASGVSLFNIDTTNTAITLQGGTTAAAVSVQSGAAGTISIGTTAQAATVTIGDATTVNTGNTQTINLGNLSVAGTTNVNIGSTTSATAGTTTITGKTAVNITGYGASTWATSGAALAINGGTTLALLSASGSQFTASSQGAGASLLGTQGTGTTELGNTTGVTNLIGPTYTTTSKGVCITATAATCGATSATPVLLDLNQSTLQGAETAGNCSTTINAGGIYYSASTASSSTTTQELRGCINGAWKDIVTADQLGLLMFGIVDDSGTAANAGDYFADGTYSTSGPCRVSWASATTVTVAPCTAYSGGRKVVITAATTVTIPNQVASAWVHVCLTGTNGAPTATASNASETAAVPAFSAAAPILCLADVQDNSSTANTIGKIYDTRVFLSTSKEFTDDAGGALAPGWIVIEDHTGNHPGVFTTTSAAAANVRGVVAVGNPNAVTNGPGAIIITRGIAFVHNPGIQAGTVGNYVQTSGIAGSAQQTTVSTTAYANLGILLQVSDNACAGTSASCNFDWPTEVNIR